ncbi:MAG: lysine exporter LysO family protein [Thermoprotei archaeon]
MIDLATVALLVVFFASMPLSRVLSVPSIVSDAVTFSLIFTIAMWGTSSLPVAQVIGEIAIGVVVALVIVTLTYWLGALLITLDAKPASASRRANLGLKYLLPLALGLLAGALIRPSLPYGGLVTFELCALMVVVGVDVGKAISLKVLRASLGFGLASTAVNYAAAVMSGLVASFLLGLPTNVSLLIALGSGWYSFTGPFLANAFGPEYGIVGFLANFLREQLVFVLVPAFAKLRESPLGGIAAGGATSMDVTLPFMREFYGNDFAMPSVVSGAVITLTVPLVLAMFSTALK